MIELIELIDKLKHQSTKTSQLNFSFLTRRFCLLYTSDAADDLLCVDLGGRRILKKKNTNI